MVREGPTLEEWRGETGTEWAGLVSVRAGLEGRRLLVGWERLVKESTERRLISLGLEKSRQKATWFEKTERKPGR